MNDKGTLPDMPAIIKPDVIDLSVHNAVKDFTEVKAYGVKGIIHKATEGTGFVDKRYRERREAARNAGLLWGAYAFGTRASAKDQALHFIKTALVDADTLIALDWEEYKSNTMTRAQAKEFLRICYEETGQRPVLYSGSLVKAQGGEDEFLCQHRLWLAQYTARAPQLPKGWDSYWLHQYSGDGFGSHGTIPGITTKGIDCNKFGGIDLAAEWAGRAQDRRPAPAPIPLPPSVVANTGHFTIPAADLPAPVAPEPPATSAGFLAKMTTATSSAAAINEMSDQGSRIATTIRRIKQWFWKALGVGAAGTGATATAVDPNQGSAAVVHAWIAAHPIWFAIIVATVLVGVFYLVIRLVEKYLVTAFKDGRYVPSGAQPVK